MSRGRESACRAYASGVRCPEASPGQATGSRRRFDSGREDDMAKKRGTKPEERKSRENTAASRREFLKQGVAAGVGAAALGSAATTSAQGASSGGIKWDYEADVVVLGAGC